jgi:hypothetical protein
MLDPVSLMIIKVIAGVLVVGWAWTYIRDFFTETLIPAIRKYVSDTLADGVATVVGWIDAPVSVVRKKAAETMASFKKHVLGIQSTYERTDTYSAKEKITTHIVRKNGAIQEITKERQIPLDNLPPNVRAEFIKHHGEPVKANVKEDFEQKVREKLKLAI